MSMSDTYGIYMRAHQFCIIEWVVLNVMAYTSDTQIWLTRCTSLQSLAPTLIKLIYLWLSNDPEDID